MLCRCYFQLEKEEPELVALWKQMWKHYDDEIFQSPETVGKAGFLTRVDDQCVGFASYDPRQLPAVGIVGHNCVLPEFRGRGYGRAQIHEIIRIFKEKGCRSIEVTTADHPFFKPAYELYRSCGFREHSRALNDTIPFELIVLKFPCKNP
jgi:GNAT superfamily N-acetyltransferase